MSAHALPWRTTIDKKPPPRRTPAAHTRPAPPQAPGSVARPYLRFYHSVKLRTRTLAVLDAIEQAPDASVHCDALAGVILELIDCGLDSYFLKSLEAAKVGFIVQQSAALGLAGVHKLMGTVVRNILVRMDGDQLRSLSGSIRQFML